jgi:hypothetical protein
MPWWSGKRKGQATNADGVHRHAGAATSISPGALSLPHSNRDRGDTEPPFSAWEAGEPTSQVVFQAQTWPFEGTFGGLTGGLGPVGGPSTAVCAKRVRPPRRRRQRLGVDNHSVGGGRPHDHGRRADACMLCASHRKHRRTGPASSRAVRTCAHPRTAIATDPRLDKVMPYAAQPVISDSLRAPCLVFEAANAHKLQPFTPDP